MPKSWAGKHRRDVQAHRWTSAKTELMAEPGNLKDWYERDYTVFSEVAHGARFGLTDAPERSPSRLSTRLTKHLAC